MNEIFNNLLNKKTYHTKFGEGYIKGISIEEDESEIDVKLNIQFMDDDRKFKLDSLGRYIYLQDIQEHAKYLEKLKEMKEKKAKQSQKSEKTRILRKRDIKYLVHFTNINNLKSIMQYGLLSIKNLRERNIDYYNTDNDRLDKQSEYICTSITFPNYKMFWKKREEMLSEKWVIIKVNSNIILEKEDTLFMPTNSANKICQRLLTQDKENLQTSQALSNLFKNSIDSRGITKYRQDRLINENMTTNPQAEVMIREEVPIKYIASIVVENEMVKRDVEKVISDDVNIEVDKSLFLWREDHENWKDEIYS